MTPILSKRLHRRATIISGRVQWGMHRHWHRQTVDALSEETEPASRWQPSDVVALAGILGLTAPFWLIPIGLIIGALQ